MDIAGLGCTLLYSVIRRVQFSLLKRLVTEVDAQAFIAIMEADDVTGVEIGNQPHLVIKQYNKAKK